MKSVTLLLLCATAVWADDGMWLFNQFPTDAVKEKREFTVTPAFLDHLRLSTVKLPGGYRCCLSENTTAASVWVTDTDVWVNDPARYDAHHARV